ncbi:MAG: hypothetical protein ACK5W7_04285 [Gemmatimonadaceae bacterium]|jgi:hypothetical protein
MTDEIPTLDQLIASGVTIGRHPKHPLWWRATQSDGSVMTCRESAFSRAGAEVWHGYAACWCLQDQPHEPDCEQDLYQDRYEDDNPVE